MTMTEEYESGTDEEVRPDVRAELPIDADTIQKAIDEVTATRLDVPPRDAIDRHTDELAEHARRLLREDYPAGQQDNSGVRTAFRVLYRLLDARLRPTSVTSDYTAWTYSRNLANATHALLDVHRQRQAP
ncbi:hypothetical protein [Streptomyces sp. NPDC050535]|uniref:hypothetical protein n=1 Tax=Streptomyces sp. NPDC050535 TaxID=3365626 RepID=UPI0037B14C98